MSEGDATVISGEAVVDASVVMKWALPEPGRAEAIALLGAYEAGRLDLVAPRLLMEEVASALAKHFRRRSLSAVEAFRAFHWIETRRPVLATELEDIAAALELSLQHQISFWDSTYLALAIRRRCDLITADQRFYRAVARHYSFARLLAS